MGSSSFEILILSLAAFSGLIILAAPVLWLSGHAGRVKGIGVGQAAGLRTWPVVLRMTIEFVAHGVVLWRPLPLPLQNPWPAILTLAGALLYFPALALYI